MKAKLTLMSICLAVTLLAQDTPSTTSKVPVPKKALTPQQAQFQKDVNYVVSNARKAYEKIDRVGNSVDEINNSVSRIVSSNERLWGQNDSLRIVQNRILTYAKQSEERAFRAEKLSKLATRESREWNHMIDISTIIACLGAIVLIIGFHIYNTLILAHIRRKLSL